MENTSTDKIYEDLDIDDEQVTSNECWQIDETDAVSFQIYQDLDLGEEQVTSNECYDVEDK